MPSCLLSAKASPGGTPDKGRRGVFAAAPIKAGERIAVWGGVAVDRGWLDRAGGHARRLALQVDEDTYLVSTNEGPGDWINHSCEPNAGIRGQITLVAMRDIAAGEEICFDYAMTDGSDYDEFDCRCGATACRGRVTGNDWRNEDLRRRYAGYFSGYLQLRIARLRETRTLGDQRSHASWYDRPAPEGA